jgi:hypothetical protein
MLFMFILYCRNCLMIDKWIMRLLLRDLGRNQKLRLDIILSFKDLSIFQYTEFLIKMVLLLHLSTIFIIIDLKKLILTHPKGLEENTELLLCYQGLD